jgi:hypothetical protein
VVFGKANMTFVGAILGNYANELTLAFAQVELF